MYTQAVSPQSCAARANSFRRSAMRFAVSTRLCSRISPMAALPLEDAGENFCLLHGVLKSVVSMSPLRAKGGQQLGLASLRDWNTGLHCKGCLDIEAKRVIER